MRGSKSIAVLAGLFIGVATAAVRAQSAQNPIEPPSPVVAMTITLPDGQVKELSTHESGLAVVPFAGHEYGFRPTLHDDQGTRMTITIFDMGNASEAVRELGTVDLKGAAPVASKTTPAFKVQARKSAVNTTT